MMFARQNHQFYQLTIRFHDLTLLFGECFCSIRSNFLNRRQDRMAEHHEEAQTIVLEQVPDYYNELSEYLEVLSNSQRLKILKILEKRPKDVRMIANEINTSYENTKKHLDKLISMGLIRKEVGLGQQTSKGVHPVWKYSLVPGAMEAVVRNLGIFSNMRININDEELKKRLDEVREAFEGEITGNKPMIIILGGSDDGKLFILEKAETRVGRIDTVHPPFEEPTSDIVLSPEYSSVSRITRPHGVFKREGPNYYFEDRGSSGGSFLNSTEIYKRQPAVLHDGDLLELGKGARGAKLLVILPDST
jgi:predicted transcriptional regulator